MRFWNSHSKQTLFCKEWPKRELAGLVSRQIVEGRNVLLPVWHKIEINDVIKFSPPLADMLASDTKNGIDNVAKQISEAVGKPVVDPRDTYLEMTPQERMKKIRSFLRMFCGMPNDLPVLCDALAFLEIANQYETDDDIKSEVLKVQTHIDEEVKVMIDEMKQYNPA